MVLNVFDLLQASKKISDPSKFDINVYLKDKVGDKGKCRHCGHTVPWSRSRVISHKRASCDSISAAEKEFFHAQHALKVIPSGKRERQVVEPEPRKQACVQKTATSWLDQLTVGERDAITRAIASMFFRTGIPFRVVESASMKALLTCIRPAYARHIPTAKTLSGSLLLEQYTELWDAGQTFIAQATSYTLISDGWSNSRNEHQVNYIVIIPGHNPFFSNSVSMASIPQTSGRIAADIIEVIKELGPSKCVAVITDNAPNMGGAWKIIEQEYALVFANGCATHAINLLIKDICNMEEFRETLADAMTVIKFVRNHQYVLAAFQDKRQQYQIKHDIVMVAPTRWYSHYNTCRYLWGAKFAVQALLEEDTISDLDAIVTQEPVTKFKLLVGSPTFWTRLRKLTSVLKFPSEIIEKFEKYNCDLFEVYYYFTQLQASWEKKLTLETTLTRQLKAAGDARWKFVNADSMGFAFMLTPKSATMKWLPQDKITTKNELIAYVHTFFDGEDAKACADELNAFLSMYPTRSVAELNEYNTLSGIQYWAQYGLSEFPLLASVALRVFTVPTSSAAAERVWSIFFLPAH